MKTKFNLKNAEALSQGELQRMKGGHMVAACKYGCKDACKPGNLNGVAADDPVKGATPVGG